jgi:hypothetical protein
MLDALRSMPQLEVLRVHHCRAVWEDDAAAGQGQGIGTASAVALPRLRLISFRDTTPRRFVLLAQRIDAPPTVRRHLFWRSWALASWERWTDLLRAMRAFVPRDSTPGADDGGLRVARVAGGAPRGSFSAWTRSAMAVAGPSQEEREEALFLFEIDWRGSPIDPRGGAETLLDHSSPFFHLPELCAQQLPTGCVLDLTVEPELEPESVSEPGLDVERTMVGADATAAAAVGFTQVVRHWESLVGALRSVQVLRLHRGSSSVLQAVAANPHLLPDLQKLYVVQCDVKRSPVLPDGGIVLRNLKRLATLRGGSPDSVMTCDAERIGNELVALVRRRYGLEVVLVGCGVDIGELDELRKHGQVSIGDGDEWVYV